MSEKLQQAITLIKAGDKQNGQRLLAEILRADPKNENAWLWMSSVVATDEQCRHCLNQVLALNPNNQLAHTGLAKLQQKQAGSSRPPQTAPLPPASPPSQPPPASPASPARPASANVPEPSGQPAPLRRLEPAPEPKSRIKYLGDPPDTTAPVQEKKPAQPPKKPSLKTWVIALLLVVGGMCGLGWEAMKLQDEMALQSQGLITEAQVTDFNTKRSRRGGATHYLAYNFEVNGVVISASDKYVASVENWEQAVADQSLQVKYLPGDPQNNRPYFPGKEAEQLGDRMLNVGCFSCVFLLGLLLTVGLLMGLRQKSPPAGQKGTT
ncbi:MAG: DUF3592 domain-containing protein [Anaerolineae bacterium]|nr:DUF3592 domain-containing protein [Anaerolineae bacterium]